MEQYGSKAVAGSRLNDRFWPDPPTTPMLRLIAFLRVISVGGHNVAMAELRGLFERFFLKEVETFIASGDVIFTSRSSDIRALQHKIESQLLRSLGYEVKAFLRTVPEGGSDRSIQTV